MAQHWYSMQFNSCITRSAYLLPTELQERKIDTLLVACLIFECCH